METERLILRKMEERDFEPLKRVLGDEETMRHYPAPFSDSKIRQWISWNIESCRNAGFGLWAVVLKESGELIGDCGITLQEVEGAPIHELGYHIRKDHWNRGLATEAAKACVAFAFGTLGLDALYSYMEERNEPSARIARKMGMALVKRFQKEIMGSVENELLYRLGREDYLSVRE